MSLIHVRHFELVENCTWKKKFFFSMKVTDKLGTRLICNCKRSLVRVRGPFSESKDAK